jgi:formylmethanofuran dehydrogenase subunit C
MIAIAGNVGRLCGWNLWAGSIVVGGNCGAECGLEMVRGTIVQLGQDNVPLLPTFSYGSDYSQGVLALLSSRLKALEFRKFADLLTRSFVLHHGDHLRGGRGEIFIAQSR